MDPIFKYCKSKDEAAYAAISALSIHVEEALNTLKTSIANQAHYRALGNLFRAQQIVSEFNSLHSRKEFF